MRLLLLFCTALLLRAQDGPRYTDKGELLRPENYRSWVYLSSGLGMTYGPAAALQRQPMFDNVFVNPEAYRSFVATGKWPDQTMLVLEVRAAQSEGSINKGGHFQGDVVAVEVNVKDEGRFPAKWAFFGFPKGASSGKPLPATAACYSCHREHGAVDNTFVQFYPTLLEVAKQKGTLR